MSKDDEPTYALGTRFRWVGATTPYTECDYLLAQTETGKAKLISLANGNRWTDRELLVESERVTVAAFQEVYKHEWAPVEDLLAEIKRVRRVT